MKKIILFTIATLSISACTDSAQGRFGSYGDEAQIYCYSGSQQIYNGTSTGKVSTSKSGFVKFMEKESEKYIEIHADCIVKYK